MTRGVAENVAAAGWKGDEEGFAAWLDVFQAQTLVVGALERCIKRELGLPLAGYEVLVRLGGGVRRGAGADAGAGAQGALVEERAQPAL
jgi:hypothetical protein